MWVLEILHPALGSVFNTWVCLPWNPSLHNIACCGSSGSSNMLNLHTMQNTLRLHRLLVGCWLIGLAMVFLWSCSAIHPMLNTPVVGCWFIWHLMVGFNQPYRHHLLHVVSWCSHPCFVQLAKAIQRFSKYLRWLSCIDNNWIELGLYTEWHHFFVVWLYRYY